MKVLLLIGLCWTVCSCTDFKRSDQLGEIDVLLNSIKAVEATYHSRHIGEIPDVLVDMNKIQNSIRNSYYDDTLDLEIAEMLDAYKQAGLNLKSIYEKDSLLSAEIKEEIRNLENLKMDIINSTGDRINYDSNIASEKAKVKEIETFVEVCLSTKNEGIETFHNLHADLQLFAIKLELKNKEQ